jgi:hypothetical protein
MGGFSAEKALGAGFLLIRRNPGAFFVWAGVYFVVGILPSGATWARLAPAMAAHQGDPQAIAAAMSGVGPLAPLLWILGFVLISVMYGAVYRAVLEPEDRRFFYLRLSMRELWLGLTILALAVVFALGIAVLAVVLTIVGRTAPWYVTIIAVLAAVVGVVWLLTRFSLASPMAFAERRFIFAESWSLTEGHALKLFGVALALVVILILIELVLIVPIALGLGLSGALQRTQDDPSAAMGLAGPWLAAGAVLLSLFGSLVYSILGAPWASIYQQLSAGRPASVYDEA